MTVQGLTYGQNKELNEAAAATPDIGHQPPGGPTGAPQGGGGNPPPPVEVQRPDVFGPSARPGEPITTGMDSGLLPEDPVALIRALYVRYPNEDLRRLLERAAEDMRGR